MCSSFPSIYHQFIILDTRNVSQSNVSQTSSMFHPKIKTSSRHSLDHGNVDRSRDGCFVDHFQITSRLYSIIDDLAEIWSKVKAKCTKTMGRLFYETLGDAPRGSPKTQVGDNLDLFSNILQMAWTVIDGRGRTVLLN